MSFYSPTLPSPAHRDIFHGSSFLTYSEAMKKPAGSPKRPLRQLLLWPLYLPTLLTGAKSFKKNPVIGNRLLNRLGLHVLRLLLAAAIFKLRRWQLAWMLDSTDRQQLQRQGFLVKESFLPADMFQRLEEEARNRQLEARICLQGDAITHRVLLDHVTQAQLPACRELLAYRPWRRMLGYAAGRYRVPGVWIHRIYNGVNPGKLDPQLTLHSDSFHPTIKAWLFLDDVDERNGPFTYVPGSHRLSLRRLVWEYRRSVGMTGEGDHYSASGSLRLGPGDSEYLNLPPPVACKVARNTLVIADTHGFHCRGASQPGSSRLAIWCISRTNPFNPLPGLPFRFLDRIDLAIFRGHLAWQDWRAARRGGKPSWRKTPPEWRPDS